MVWAFFEYMCTELEDECGYTSNRTKVKGWQPSGGGVHLMPNDIVKAQDGELPGIKCVGGYVAAATVAGTTWAPLL